MQLKYLVTLMMLIIIQWLQVREISTNKSFSILGTPKCLILKVSFRGIFNTKSPKLGHSKSLAVYSSATYF